MTKRQLRIRLKKAVKLLADERLRLDAARHRVDYWSKVVKNTEERLDMVKNGQVEMNLD